MEKKLSKIMGLVMTLIFECFILGFFLYLFFNIFEWAVFASAIFFYCGLALTLLLLMLSAFYIMWEWMV